MGHLWLNSLFLSTVVLHSQHVTTAQLLAVLATALAPRLGDQGDDVGGQLGVLLEPLDGLQAGRMV